MLLHKKLISNYFCFFSDEELNWSWVADGISELKEVAVVRELPPYNNASSTHNLALPKCQVNASIHMKVPSLT